MHQEKHIDWLGRWKHVLVRTATYRITLLDHTPILYVIIHIVGIEKGFCLMVQLAKNPPARQETQVQSLGGEDSLEKENGNPLQYSCLEKSMETAAWWATIHGVTKSQTCDLVTKPPPFYIARLIMFPLWLAIVIIHLFFVWPLIMKTDKHLLLFHYVTITHLIPLYHDWSTEK